MSLYNSQLYANNYYMLQGIGDYQLFNDILWGQNDMWASLKVNQIENRSSLVTQSFYFPFKISTKNLGTPVKSIRFGYLDSIEYGAANFIYITPNKTSFSIYRNFTFSSTDIYKYITNSFLDYDTICEYKLYLPFIGIVPIDGKLIYDTAHSIYINYHCDLSTGACVCNIVLDNSNNRIYQYPVSCTNISPYSGVNNNYIANKGWSLLGNIVTTAIGTRTGSSFNSTNIHKSTSRNQSTGRQITTGTETNTTTGSKNSTTRFPYNITNGLVDLANSQIPTTINGNSSPDISLDSILAPYIIIKRPRAIYYTGYNSLNGRPLNESRKLNLLRGYTEVSTIHLNIPCMTDELEEIEELLHEGVILNTNAPIPDPPPGPEPEPTPTPTPTPTPAPDTPKEDDPISPNAPTLPEGETATMLCCFNGKFRVTGMRGKPSDTGRPRNHYGLDLVGMDTSATNTPVYAISSGWVKLTDEGERGLGKCVHVQMDNKNYYGEWILYGHLSKFEVKNGQYVEKGQLIGIMGNTGASDGWHTHLEWRNKYDKWDADFNKYDICKFTGIPNTSVEGQNVHIGSPIYKTANGASVQSKLGLENQTIEYLESYEYADDLMKKIDDHTK